ncbi:MAG TPA: HypC/HybG/HupF family hydrogenase formation chaperone [Patescibacteria group bacterium]|nr:HypC/HybG/HupF family hydrogenase formation chaperone [Patescibacteria group bacterium]
MCLSIPVQITEIINEKKVKIKSKNGEFEIDTSLLPGLKKDDWILVQENSGVKKIDKQTADKIFELIS